jgi:hypothetical protein
VLETVAGAEARTGRLLLKMGDTALAVISHLRVRGGDRALIIAKEDC